MDLDSIKQCWRQDAQLLPPVLEEETVMRMLADRTIDLRRQVRHRLRREAGYYLPLMAVMAASLAGGFTLNRVLAVCTGVFMIGGIMVALKWAERRLDDTPLDRSLRDALTDLGSKVDAACRAYVAAYVVFFVVTSLILLGLIWRQNGAGSLFAGSLLIAVLTVVWSVRSGRGYVERMFRPYRVDLSECLRQLDEQT